MYLGRQLLCKGPYSPRHYPFSMWGRDMMTSLRDGRKSIKSYSHWVESMRLKSGFLTTVSISSRLQKFSSVWEDMSTKYALTDFINHPLFVMWLNFHKPHLTDMLVHYQLIWANAWFSMGLKDTGRRKNTGLGMQWWLLPPMEQFCRLKNMSLCALQDPSPILTVRILCHLQDSFQEENKWFLAFLLLFCCFLRPCTNNLQE